MTYAFLAFIAFIAFLGAAAAAFAAFLAMLLARERNKPQGMRMSLKTSFLEHQAMNTYIMQSLQITCTGHKRKLRLARSHSAAQGRGPRVTLKGPLGTLPPNPPGPPGTKIPPVITLIGAIIWNRSGSFSMFF